MSPAVTRRLHLLLLGTMAAACSQRPSSQQLDGWRTEAAAVNAAAMLKHPRAAQVQWNLGVHGQVGTPLDLDLPKLEKLATTIVKTRTATNTADPTQVQVSEYRGVSIATLLDEAGVQAGATDVTVLGLDAFRSTISVADAHRWPGIMLALEKDGKPIAQNDGGPVQIIFPYSEHPEIEQVYAGNWWCWYVTDVIVGTEAPHIRLGGKAGKVLGLADLAKLEQVSFTVEVGYKVNWPNGAQKLTGVRLRDVMHAAGMEIPPTGKVIVTGKAQIDHDASRPTAIAGADVLTYDVLLALRWGDGDAPIPGAMGGPVTLAFPSECKANYPEKRWVTYVEGIEIAVSEPSP